MNLFQKAIGRFANVIPANITIPNRTPPSPMNMPGGLTLYPSGRDITFINKGYKGNAWVYAIVSRCAKKFAQVPWYHYRIKRNERKTWGEYIQLTKDGLNTKSLIEAKKMRIKSVEQTIVESDLSKLLAKPNRNQSGGQYREELYGYKLLTGEGNTWLSKPDGKGQPQEMFVIPKANLGLVRGGDPWAIDSYKLLLGGQEFNNAPENVIMWKFPNYEFDPVTLSHLRGMAPLDAGLLLLQSTNEAQERLAAMNKNQGVAGMVVNEGVSQTPTIEQALFMRSQFNSIVNDRDLAGTIAYMTGKLSFMQFGMTADQLQLLEQLDASIEWFCNIFDYPSGLLTKNQTHENQKEQGKNFIYNNIAVQAYSLRDEYNEKLLTSFGLDRERDVVDCDLISLPELADDQDKAAAFLEKLGGRLTYNEGRELLGYDRVEDPNMDKHYVPANLTSLEDLNQDLGTGLDNELNLLNGQ